MFVSLNRSVQFLGLACLAIAVAFASWPSSACGEMLAGAAKVDITNREAGPVNDPLYVKALVLRSGEVTFALITVDAVAIGEIGYIGNDYLPAVRSTLEKDLHIPPARVMINASHCHGVVCKDVTERTVQAVTLALKRLEPVKVGVGVGREDRIQENRRLKLKNGKEIDVRHAYSLPPDEEVDSVGPIDPAIGVLRIDRLDGSVLAVVYNFACHPIQSVPSGANSADMTGFASTVIEENLGEDCVALFVQGCAGDINPAFYKDVNRPRDGEPLGNLLGLSTLRAVRKITTRPDDRLTVHQETLELPRADLGQRIIAMEAERERLVQSLRGTYLNLKRFLPLAVKHSLDEDFPAYDSQRYLHEEALGREHLRKLDADNRAHLRQYIRNIHTMEEISRLNTNLALLRKHQAQWVEAGERDVQVELLGFRIGDFVMTTFPGELTVQIGLNLKSASPHEHTFVAGYTNGYIYYAPTAEQLKNLGGAQEDSDCILSPPWQAIYEKKAAELLGKL